MQTENPLLTKLRRIEGRRRFWLAYRRKWLVSHLCTLAFFIPMVATLATAEGPLSTAYWFCEGSLWFGINLLIFGLAFSSRKSWLPQQGMPR
jgi:hypothetical protein